MPRFFFDLHDGPSYSRDEFGDEFDEFEDARQHAQAILGDVLVRELPGGEDRTLVCEVRDDAHDVVYRCKLTLHGESLCKTAVAA